MVKLHPDLLRKYVFSRVGHRDPSVVVGPAYGEDSAIIDVGPQYLVAHIDPITGAVENIGWLAVHIACNDVAVRGAEPRWLMPTILLPESYGEQEVDAITKQIDQAAREVGAMVVGGHTEFTPGIDRPFISMAAMGLTEDRRYVLTSGAEVGDAVLMTKTAGTEGTSILAEDFSEDLLKRGVKEELLKRGAEFIKRISVVREALLLAKMGANSMHDPTEGGVLGGLAEIAYASNKLIEVWEEKIPIAEETKIFCKALDIDPLKLISSGVLIATLPHRKAADAVNALRAIGVEASVIGVVKEGSGLLLNRVSGGVEVVGEYVGDELMRLWSEREAGKLG